MSGTRSFLIVGGGLAAGKAAETLRERGFDGAITVVCAEPFRPYERPPLSKERLRGEGTREDVFVHPEGYYAEHDIELLLANPARTLDLGARRVTLADGRGLDYDALLLATGAEPRRLSVPGSDVAGIHHLRTIEDSESLHDALAGGGRQLVVIGGGWIGCEVAASARALGAEVTMLPGTELPLEHVLGPELGRFYADVHASNGVTLIGSETVTAVEGDGRVERVRTSGGRALDCDLVAVGIGVVPAIGLAEGAGLAIDNGITCDARLATSAAGVFAAGDVANHDHPRFGRLRVEHWHNALEQGPAAARAMLGDGAAYDGMPYFFSDQYDVGMEYAGHAVGAERVVVRGDVAAREFIAFWLRGEAVLAGMNVNVWDVTDDIQALIASGAAVDEARLTDPDVPLAELAAAGR